MRYVIKGFILFLIGVYALTGCTVTMTGVGFGVDSGIHVYKNSKKNEVFQEKGPDIGSETETVEKLNTKRNSDNKKSYIFTKVGLVAGLCTDVALFTLFIIALNNLSVGPVWDLDSCDDCG